MNYFVRSSGCRFGFCLKPPVRGLWGCVCPNIMSHSLSKKSACKKNVMQKKKDEETIFHHNCFSIERKRRLPE